MKPIWILTCAVLLAAPLAAAQDDDILKKRISDPVKDVWQTQGKWQKTSSAVKSEGVPGGYAYRVQVYRPDEKPWEVAAQAPISGAMKQGDVVLLGFWARAQEPAEGVVNARIQQSAEPYAAIAEVGGLKIGPEWKMYYVSGKSPMTLGPGQGNVSVHLASARQTIDLGPFTVLDLGPDYDVRRLPKN